MVLFNQLLKGWDNVIHSFPNGICPKVSTITRLEFELVYYEVAVKHFSHCTMGTPPLPPPPQFRNSI